MISDEIYSLIGSESFIMVNKKVLRILKGNADASVLLIELINIHKMLMNKLSVDDFGYFKVPYNWINKTLGMSSGKQKTILTILSKMDLITSVTKGYPASRHISLNFFNIKALLEMDETTKEDIQRAEFYQEINLFIQQNDIKGILQEKRVFGKMKENLRESIKYITIYNIVRYKHNNMVWASRDVGILRDFVNKKSMGKPFDYAFLKKVLDKDNNHSSVSEIVNSLIKISRGTPDNSPADQVFEIKELV